MTSVPYSIHAVRAPEAAEDQGAAGGRRPRPAPCLRPSRLGGRSAARMKRLVNDLVDLTRARLGAGLPVTTGPVDRMALCPRVLEELEVCHPGRVIRFAPSGDLHGEWDGDRLAQRVGLAKGAAPGTGPRGWRIRVASRLRAPRSRPRRRPTSVARSPSSPPRAARSPRRRRRSGPDPPAAPRGRGARGRPTGAPVRGRRWSPGAGRRCCS